MPPEQWQVPVILLLGVIVGLGLYILRISNAASYLSDDSETCVNCHVMNPQYATWSHSAHREVTSCNDCHVPHDNVFSKYFFKAKDGMRHATMFTLRQEPQVIFIKEAGKEVVQENCIRCHEKLLTDNAGISAAQEARIKLARLFAEKGFNEEVPYPDLSTKARAQEFIGLPMDKLKEEKETFKQNLLPKWLEEAKKREEGWGSGIIERFKD